MDSVLYNPPARRDEVQGVRKKFISSEGDHITLLNIYRTFKNIGGNKVSFVLFLFSNVNSFFQAYFLFPFSVVTIEPEAHNHELYPQPFFEFYLEIGSH